MALQRSTTRQISAPVDQVFAAISDVKHIRQVSPSMLNIEILSDVKSGVGLRFRETRKMGKREASTIIETTEYEPNKCVRMVSDEGGTIWDSLFTVKSTEDGGTEMKLEMEAKPYKFMPRLVVPIMLGVISKFVEADMDAVKVYCEAGKAALADSGN